jgi:alpha-mannosidase
MATEADIHAVVTRWRTNVKKKFRGIASFEERAQLRFDAIRERIYTHRVKLDDWLIRQCRYVRPGQYDWIDKTWRSIRVGQQWGGDHVTGFFKRRIVIPGQLAGQRVALRIYVGGDSMLWINGAPFSGLDPFRHEVLLTPKARAGQVLTAQLESYVAFNGGDNRMNDFIVAELVGIDQRIASAYWDLWAVAKALQIVDIDPRLEEFLAHHLWEAMKLVPLRQSDDAVFKPAVIEAARRVRREIYASDRFRGEGLMHLVGQSHLDWVYMWPQKEFVRKVGRTHATMLRLMEQYPQFKFAQSQAKLYADMKEHHPEIWRQVKRRIRQGRWEPIGAFWIEPDCNLVSGESFVRQIIHGQRFFLREFGMRSRTCWQPDVFGLSWGLPQILARAGIEYFITHKMVAWNDTNPWKTHTFWWEGPDGSRVLGIVPPGHFIGTVDPDVLDMQWRNFSDKQTVGQTCHMYGWGDGGGGPDPEMLEQAIRYSDFPGLVKTKFSGAEEAFDQIKAKAAKAQIATLRDEIYLEAHRGTYTHRGRLKKLNRQAELLYREAEILSSLAWMNGAEYPTGQLDAGWKDLLTQQMHDALPGTHIGEVYPELLAGYDGILKTGSQVRQSAAGSIARRLFGLGRKQRLVVLNSTLQERDDLVAVPTDDLAGRRVTDDAGRPLVQQDVADLDGTRRTLIESPPVPPVGLRVLGLTSGKAPGATRRVGVTDRSLENEHLRATFSDDGRLLSLIDKGGDREVLVRGEPGNRFQLFEDTPGRYDAWDIVETYRDHEIDIAGNAHLRVDETGPLRASLLLVKRIANSTLTQRISLAAGSQQLVFETMVDWRERQRLLKVGFTVDVNTDHATYDMAYGSIARPNHRNNSHAAARFEVCGHQWMDMSQGDWGVSLLNDGKFGHDALGKTMRLTLLKGSIHPDPNADVETHHFTYALYPHSRPWQDADTIGQAMRLNSPLYATLVNAGAAGDPTHGFLNCNVPNLTLEAIKQGEDGRHVVVRLVERCNRSTHAKLTFDRPARGAWSCDLMEQTERKLPTPAGRVELRVKPCEIVTLRLAF